ncbi:MAG: glutathione S-transferase family protein [Pseudomonadota bacterium]
MNIEALKLYHFPGSRSARVRWALHETWGDDFSLETMQLLKGEQYVPEFLQKNPNHAVPVLAVSWEDGSTQHVLESTAIVEWLAESFADKNLAPSPGLSRERSDYLQMLHFGGSWMDSMLWQIRVHRDLLPKTEADPRVVERAMAKLADEVEPQLVTRLSASDYICGDRFSAADIVIGHNVGWARVYGLCKHEVLSNYRARLAARPAFQQAFADLAKKNPVDS